MKKTKIVCTMGPNTNDKADPEWNECGTFQFLTW